MRGAQEAQGEHGFQETEGPCCGARISPGGEDPHLDVVLGVLACDGLGFRAVILRSLGLKAGVA